MSKKRTSPESSNDEQTIEGSDSVIQEDDNSKRAKLSLLSDTTLQDLPIELIECILIKAVVMEVNGVRLAKSAWKAKADLVINRLRTVCSQWSNTLTTNFFRKEIYRTLDGTAQKTIRMENLHQCPLQTYVCGITTLKDEIFFLCYPRDEDKHVIHVYDRNNMAKVKDVIQLGDIWAGAIAACNVSNCVYILNSGATFNFSVLRITRDDRRQFNISPLISNLWMKRRHNLSVTANGSLVLLKWQISDQQIYSYDYKYNNNPEIGMYDANGSLQHEIKLSSDLASVRSIVPKSNGNLVLVSCNDQRETKLTEIDMYGTILRQYQSSLCAYTAICHADIHGRMLLTDELNRIELLDSEFNLLDFTCSQQYEAAYAAVVPTRLHYNSERNEVVAMANYHPLTIFRFTEE